MKRRTDQEICVDAVRDARRVLSEFSDPGSKHDAKASLFQIMEVLDDRTVDAALERIDGRAHFGVVEGKAVAPSKDEDKY